MRVSKKEAMFYMEAIKAMTGGTIAWLASHPGDDFEIEPERAQQGGGNGGPTLLKPCFSPPTAGDFGRFAASAVLWGKFVGLKP